MNAVDLILEEHKKAKAAFAKIEQASPDERGVLWAKLEDELKIHEQMEDKFLYVPLSQDPKTEGTKLGEFEDKQQEDVADAEHLMSQIDSEKASSDEWIVKVKALHAALGKHIQIEETQILPKIKEIWPEDKLAKAGKDMQAFQQEQLKARA